jgi:hypothetical protein
MLFQVEKLAVLRHYKKPLHYSIEMPKVVARFLPYAIVVNLLQSMWMYADNETLPSSYLSTNSKRYVPSKTRVRLLGRLRTSQSRITYDFTVGYLSFGPI